MDINTTCNEFEEEENINLGKLKESIMVFFCCSGRKVQAEVGKGCN